MSYQETSYVAKPVDSNGYANYTSEENQTWTTLFVRQNQIIQGRACEEFHQGLKILNLISDRIPQCPEVTEILRATTGWSVEPVSALISFDRFFQLLANKRFPAATFIRRQEELDYIKEPDIFHEIYGHCPLLTNPAYAEFTQLYGKLGLNATPQQRVLLARLFWFTIEFGLIKTNEGLRAYGGGILSSKNETIYALESNIPTRQPFDVNLALRTVYRIDVIQPTYFVIKSFDELFQLIDLDLVGLIQQVQAENDAKPRHPC